MSQMPSSVMLMPYRTYRGELWDMSVVVTRADAEDACLPLRDYRVPIFDGPFLEHRPNYATIVGWASLRAKTDGIWLVHVEWNGYAAAVFSEPGPTHVVPAFKVRDYDEAKQLGRLEKIQYLMLTREPEFDDVGKLELGPK